VAACGLSEFGLLKVTMFRIDRLKRFLCVCVRSARVVFAVFLLAGCTETPDRTVSDTQPEVEDAIPFTREGALSFVRADGSEIVEIAIEIADTDSARARGLMQRDRLPDRSGMLFIFDREQTQSFWMSNTPVALDIMYVNRDSVIVDIHKYVPPLSERNVVSRSPAQYVVEVPAGFSDSWGILESDRVRWTRDGQ
jgi:uncharacterized membrane protein (UPF0127 family)